MTNKTIRRIAAAVLMVCMLTPTLASCERGGGGDKTTTVPKDTAAATLSEPVSVDLAEYTVIRPTEADDDTVDAARAVYTALSAVCGTSVKFTDDFLARGTEPDDNTKEILIGSTNRPQSSSALSALTSYGYAVRLDGNKICVVASDSHLLAQAADDFISEYINVSDHGKLNLTEEILLTKNVDISLGDYTIVLRTGRDSYEEEQASVLAGYMEKAVGRSVRLISEADRAYSASACEILIGDVDCPEVDELKKTLGVSEYGVFSRGNKILLFGWSLATTIESVQAFMLMLKDNTLFSGGDFKLSSAENTEYKLSRDGWITDFPQFTGGVAGLPDGTYDCGYGELAYYYSGVGAAEVSDYRAKLSGSGYSLYSENKTGALAFSVYQKSGSALYLLHNTSTGLFRIISASDSHMVSNDTKSYTKAAELSLTQMCLDYSSSDVGMSYIITLEDGRLVIVDGGHPLATEASDLMNKLKELNRLGGKPVIAAWIITHTHSDHSGLFKKFTELYAGSVTLERMVLNLPSKYTYYNTNHSSYFYPEIEYALTKYSGTPQIIIPQTGDIMSLPGAEFEFLYTHVDYYPNNLDVFNDSSLVFRVSAGNQTILFLGDVQPDAAAVIVNMYGTQLKSDMVQMAHHGYANGGSKELYALVDPAIAFWPSSSSLYESRKTVGVGAYVIGSLHVKEVIRACEESRTIPLPYNK